MPLYELRCGCGYLETILLSFDQYDEFESTECSECKAELTKKHREICSNIKTIVTGPGKGNYNSGDFT